MSIANRMKSTQPAVLVLADGSVFRGFSIGVTGTAVGELVFNTGMTGYQEILTDPSYVEQLVVLTYPHIGNVGVNAQDSESHRVWTAGLVMRDLSATVSNYRAESTLQEYLKQHQQVAISGVDTRRLTRLLREKGAQHGCIMAGEVIDVEKARQLAQAYPGIQGKDLAKKVSTRNRVLWEKGTFELGVGEFSLKQSKYRVVVYDFGVKHQMLRLLVDRGCRLTLVPAQTPAQEVMALNPDGVLLSNGPGDPAACDYAIENIRQLMVESVPLLGICLGFQLIALACGARTVKMKFGHHGINHPVEAVDGRRVFISSQNHSFAVDTDSLPDCLAITHRSLFDGSLQGIEHREKPVFAFQGHPESSPGPQDLRILFDYFITLIERSVNAKT